jgi:sugar lactone lactonase YvrE
VNPNIKLFFGFACDSLCGGLLLVSISAPAQNLFVTVGNLVSFGKVPGYVYEFSPNGIQSTFASQFPPSKGLAFDHAGNLFVTTGTGLTGAIDEFTPGGAESTFATGLINPTALAFDRAGNLFVASGGPNGSIYEYTPGGVKSIFATGLLSVNGLAINSAGDLFVTSLSAPVGPLPRPNSGTIYEFTPGGVKSTFASGLVGPSALAFDSTGNLFVASGTIIDEYTPDGVRSTLATGQADPTSLAFDSAGDLYVSNGATFGTITGGIFEYTPSGVWSTFASGVHASGLAFQGEILPVPEPETLGLLFAGVISLLVLRTKECCVNNFESNHGPTSGNAGGISSIDCSKLDPVVMLSKQHH